ncbi:uncharacterized protein LOC125027143 isoform X2 [Penaeus chinensis]|uniref:uncharacterized protein LOC125027143 isoform X2 n=1 Tax=Penaeus chinensis TaxID=139456 RepID=UPI001FB59631|nr:uncharacterized protein LOC125027143 isoform X2 [Penaeus chinensis]
MRRIQCAASYPIFAVKYCWLAVTHWYTRKGRHQHKKWLIAMKTNKKGSHAVSTYRTYHTTFCCTFLRDMHVSLASGILIAQVRRFSMFSYCLCSTYGILITWVLLKVSLLLFIATKEICMNRMMIHQSKSKDTSNANVSCFQIVAS